MVRICTGEVWVRSSSRSRRLLALLIRDHQRVLGIARRVAGREIHALEVVIVGLNLWTDANRVAKPRKDRDQLVRGAGDGVLRAHQAARAREGDVKGFSSQLCIGRTSARASSSRDSTRVLSALKR
jgi:hypothetical protein